MTDHGLRFGKSIVEADNVSKSILHFPPESTSKDKPNSRLKHTLPLSNLLDLAKLFIYFLNSQCTTLDPTAAAPLYTAHILETVLEVVDDIPVFGCGYLSWSGHREGSASGGVVVVVLGGSEVKLEIGVGRRGRGSLRWSQDPWVRLEVRGKITSDCSYWYQLSSQLCYKFVRT